MASFATREPHQVTVRGAFEAAILTQSRNSQRSAGPIKFSHLPTSDASPRGIALGSRGYGVNIAWKAGWDLYEARRLADLNNLGV